MLVKSCGGVSTSFPLVWRGPVHARCSRRPVRECFGGRLHRFFLLLLCVMIETSRAGLEEQGVIFFSLLANFTSWRRALMRWYSSQS